MKIILLYGPGEAGKRDEAFKLKNHFAPEAVSRVDLKNENLSRLENSLVSPSLFSTGQRLIVAENTPDKFDLQKLPPAGPEVTLLLLAGSPRKDTPLIESAEKLKAFIRIFAGEEEVSAFTYLDYLLEQKKEAFLELQKLLKEYGGMYVLTMIYYLLRRNLLPLPASAFMQKKVSKQKARFKPDDWPKFYLQTIKAEFAIKSGIMTEGVALTRLTQTYLQTNK